MEERKGKGMELERCRTLLCVLELESISAAAEKLGYTPSGISRMMASLEKEMGFPLLYRGRDGVKATPECRMLLPSIREFIYGGENCLQLSAKIRGLDTGRVVIGTAYSAYYVWISRVIANFRKQYPGITVEIKNGFSTQLAKKLEEREADLCLISRREGDFDWIPLCEDEIVAVVPHNHLLAEKETVSIKEFTKEPYIDIFPGEDSDNKRVFEAGKITPNTQFTTTDSDLAYSMVEAGLGITMNNAVNVRKWSEKVKILPLNPPQSIEIGIAAVREKSPAAETFFNYVKEFNS